MYHKLNGLSMNYKKLPKIYVIENKTDISFLVTEQ